MHRLRIIGLGNRLRGDDAVGLLVAARLRRRVGDRMDVVEAEMAGLEILELMVGARAVILIDAARGGWAPGTIHRFDASAGPIGREWFPHSSHALNTADTLELGRAVGSLPPTVIVYGVEVGDTGAGRPLSPSVAQALEDVVDRVYQEAWRVGCKNFIS